MYSSDQSIKLIDDTKQKLEELSSISVPEIIRITELGTELNFVDINTELANTIRISKLVQNIKHEDIPYSAMKIFNANLKAVISKIEAIQGFSATGANPKQSRTASINNFRTAYDKYYTSSLPLLIFSQLVNEERVSVLNDVSNIKKQAAIELKTIENIAESARNAAHDTGVSVHSKLFQNESDEHDKAANKWLWGTIVILITIIVAAICSVPFGLGYNEPHQILQITITKIFILSALFYLLSLSSRNYKAHRHNGVLNKHRQNALNTFQTFSEASTDIQTKNAILLETTHTIFSNQHTGYLKSDIDIDSSNKIIEVIKNVSPTSES